MRDGKKEFEICKKACEDAGCYLPEEHEFHGTVANTPMFIRTYFYAKGWEESKGKSLNTNIANKGEDNEITR